ncbi:MAG: mandelate racemase/muconate lactonizing enzyme family protein [Candidatus Limiplasma sp.]|nr:mandelate racemase/muconate lactonizing enzyme family protein [Candidatus Limiplasma sp.]
MRITKVEPIVLKVQLEGNQQFAYSQAWYDSRVLMILRIETDAGITGWGEAFGPAFVHKAIIESVYAPMITGMDPMDTTVIWETLYNRLQDHGQKGVCIEAISAIDIALWDIKGKALHLPCYQLFGGAHRQRVKPYATGLYHRNSPRLVEELVEEATGYVQQGFRGVKLKIGFGIEEDKKKIRAIRKAIGDDIALMVDANHAYNSRTAIDIGHVMEECNVAWFEEPVPPEDLDGYLAVKQALKVPIAGGEAEFTKYGYYTLLDRRAVDILQMDNCVMGGPTEYFRVIPQAQVKNVQCCPHIWGSAIAVRTGLHVALAQPDFPKSLFPEESWLELDRTANIFREELSQNKLVIQDGYIEKPVEPGLGLEIDEDLILRYRVG